MIITLNTVNTKNIAVYTALSFALIWGVTGVFRICGGEYKSPAGTAVASLCMCIPFIVTLIMQLINREKLLSKIGFNWKVNRWWFIGWLLMPLLALMILGINLLMPGVSFSSEGPAVVQMMQQLGKAPGDGSGAALVMALTLASGLFAGISINALFALGEETGWRGYLHKQFSGKSFLFTAVLTGVIWGFWHAPMILLGHNYPQHPVAGVFMMVVFCVLITPTVQYFRIKSGSVIPAAIIHGTFNAVVNLSLMFIDSYNDLVSGGSGLAGFIALAILDLGLFLFDRYVTRDRIFSSAIQ